MAGVRISSRKVFADVFEAYVAAAVEEHGFDAVDEWVINELWDDVEDAYHREVDARARKGREAGMGRKRSREPERCQDRQRDSSWDSDESAELYPVKRLRQTPPLQSTRMTILSDSSKARLYRWATRRSVNLRFDSYRTGSGWTAMALDGSYVLCKASGSTRRWAEEEAAKGALAAAASERSPRSPRACGCGDCAECECCECCDYLLLFILVTTCTAYMLVTSCNCGDPIRRRRETERFDRQRR